MPASKAPCLLDFASGAGKEPPLNSEGYLKSFRSRNRLFVFICGCDFQSNQVPIRLRSRYNIPPSIYTRAITFRKSSGGLMSGSPLYDATAI